MPLQGHLKVQLVPAVTEKGTHDSAGTLREYQVCFAVQKMSQKETTRVITSSSDKLHYAEGEEMNEELLKGSFQLLISQLKPGAFFFPSDTQNYYICWGEVATGGKIRNPLLPRFTLGDFCTEVTIHPPVPEVFASTRPEPAAQKQLLELQNGAGRSFGVKPRDGIGQISTEPLASTPNPPTSHHNQHSSCSSLISSPKERDTVHTARRLIQPHRLKIFKKM